MNPNYHLPETSRGPEKPPPPPQKNDPRGPYLYTRLTIGQTLEDWLDENFRTPTLAFWGALVIVLFLAAVLLSVTLDTCFAAVRAPRVFDDGSSSQPVYGPQKGSSASAFSGSASGPAV